MPEELTKHEKLYERAEEAINDLHGDTSVSIDETIESLESLRSDLTEKITILRDERTPF